MRNPTLVGAGLAKASFLAGMPCENTTPFLALKQIYERVAVSEPVTLVIAAHAGLIRESR